MIYLFCFLAGRFEVSVEAWTSNGETTLKHVSRSSEVIVRDDENFSIEG
jgi:hypothetical protein